MDIWDRKERLDKAAEMVEWHGADGDACPRCHVLVPAGLLLNLPDSDLTGCLRCLEMQAFVAALGIDGLPADLASVGGQQDAQRRIADEFRQHIKAARRGQDGRVKPGRSAWRMRDVPNGEGHGDGDDEHALHNGWPVRPKSQTQSRLRAKSNEAMINKSGRASARFANVKTAKANSSKAGSAKVRQPIRRPAGKRPPTPHELLGLSGQPSLDEINAAFRRCALQCHPDHGGSVEAFRKLVAARDMLLAEN